MNALGNRRGNRLAALGPSEGCRRGPMSKGANTSLCMSLPDLIKRPFATDGCLFVGDFVKDFPVVEERALLSSLTHFSQSPREHPGRFTSDCALIDRPKFHFDYELFRPEPSSLVDKSPLRFHASEPRLTFPSLTFSPHSCT